MDACAREEFARFFHDAEQKLRVALVGAFGPDSGRDAAAEALAWGWQNWVRLRAMENPIGYLYRVGRSAGLKESRRRQPRAAALDELRWEAPDFEPQLAVVLANLSENQRVAVWMVHGLGFPHGEVAEVLDPDGGNPCAASFGETSDGHGGEQRCLTAVSTCAPRSSGFQVRSSRSPSTRC
jgi:DNA-directed RNA polymerase specialized sigma24 family protein